jgi:hypothetical protein
MLEDSNVLALHLPSISHHPSASTAMTHYSTAFTAIWTTVFDSYGFRLSEVISSYLQFFVFLSSFCVILKVTGGRPDNGVHHPFTSF